MLTGRIQLLPLIDWGIATAADQRLRLSDLVDRMLKNAVQFIRQKSRMPHFHLMGYCLGGTLATIFTALYPSVVKDLVLMSAPIDLGEENNLLKVWASEGSVDVEAAVAAFGKCPGALLRSIFALVDPIRNLYGMYDELAAGMHDVDYVDGFVASVLGECPGSRTGLQGVFRDVLELLYQRNLLAPATHLAIYGTPCGLIGSTVRSCC